MGKSFNEQLRDEDWRAFDVESLAEDYGAVLVSAVRSYGNLGPFRPRQGIDFKGVRLFDILLRPDQIICSSTVSPGDTSNNLYGRWGVVIGSGVLKQAFPYDATTAVVDNEVTSIFLERLEGVSQEEQVAAAVNARTVYNEINVQANHIAGVYYSIAENEDPTKLDLPSEATAAFMSKIGIPAFVLRDGLFYEQESSESPFTVSDEPLRPTEIISNSISISPQQREDLMLYLTENLVLAPRNAISSGYSRGEFAHRYRSERDGVYEYEDFLREQAAIIDTGNRPSLRLYGGVALHSFAEAAHGTNELAAARARRMGESVLSRSDFLAMANRIEDGGMLRIERSDFEHYLKSGNLPEHLSDH